MFDLSAWTALRRAAVEGAMAPLFGDAWPAAFAAPLRYPLETGGKRVRPLLCLAACEAVAADPADLAPALPAAVALELVHTYSLVHDDLPDMDDDDLRRGLPTVHARFDPATAILVGDALLTEAFAVLARAPLPPAAIVELVGLLADAAGYRGMVGGQAADVGVGGRVDDLDGVLRLHAGKTGRMLLAAVEMGGVVGGASPAQRALLGRAGRALGLAFQLVDDAFDADEDEGPNAARLLGVAGARARARALADEALALVAELPRPDALAALSRFVVERTH